MTLADEMIVIASACENWPTVERNCTYPQMMDVANSTLQASWMYARIPANDFCLNKKPPFVLLDVGSGVVLSTI